MIASGTPENLRVATATTHMASSIETGTGSVGEVARLATLFPEAVPMRMPIRVLHLNADGQAAGEAPQQRLAISGADPDEALAVSGSEETVIQFGTDCEVIFVSGLGLDFEDRIRVQNADGSLDVEARVVALHMANGQTAVAARFVRAVKNWIIQKVRV